jgi:site-specific DNA recombinase
MKRKAILYLRVSTDEQADKGFSLRYQLEVNTKYCDFYNIEIVAVFTDDHSAKSFDRPEFKALLAQLKSKKLSADLLLFTKWDRFSRNAADAYGMIGQLNKYGIEPQAIEQPLDLNVPENKIMLAIYLATPEVENDRRALNVIGGMRRARKEGRWVASAPLGYKNIRTEDNRPIIVPSKDALLVKWAFEELAKGTYDIEEIRRLCNRKGMKCSRSNFWNLVRNPLYTGQIFIPAYKKEEASFVKGIHEPIITEELFYRVQDVLNGKRRRHTVTNTQKDELPLRGLLECKQCGGKLTGSASKGVGGRYFYYHCQKGCKERFSAIKANEIFVEELKAITPSKNVLNLFEKIVTQQHKDNGKDKAKMEREINTEITKHQTRINNAQQLMLDGQLEAKDYRDIKDRYEGQIHTLKRKIADSDCGDIEFKEYVRFGVSFLQNLSQHYVTANTTIKQKIVSSIFSKNLIFENKAYRTDFINPAIALICNKGKGLQQKKTGNKQKKLNVSSEVASTGIEPVPSESESEILSIKLRSQTSLI